MIASYSVIPLHTGGLAVPQSWKTSQESVFIGCSRYWIFLPGAIAKESVC